MREPTKAPFPWFGGKSRVADLVWARFGQVRNYVEPFAGSLAVLLGRPAPFDGPETVNDLDCYLANFWRALAHDPEAVAEAADWPVNEADLLARHKWLMAQDQFKARMKADPEYCDARIAGWWVWGICSWIGSGWCRAEANQLPHLGAGMGINRKLPHLGDAGRGIAQYFEELAGRLRRVRVACGEWDRVLGPSVTFKHGLTGVFLDPPYDDAADGAPDIYSASSNVSAAVWQWACENGENPLLRIAVCGFDDGRELPAGWTETAWKRAGGFGSQSDGRGRANAGRERIWFSPHCLPEHDLVSLMEAANDA